jgi:hydroxymethylpyrimidine/phosphomethylpyrimidine kinase
LEPRLRGDDEGGLVTAPPRILAIAGSDSSGGAGIQADIKTITMLGGYAMTAITAVTAQNTVGVQAIEVLSPELVVAQIDACLTDIGADAVKIGMLGSPEVAHAVADRLEGMPIPIVFDPVIIATSGAILADAAVIGAFGRLMALSTVTTPNVPELEALTGISAANEPDMGRAAEHLMRAFGARSVLAKGGHWPGGIIRHSDGREISTDGLVFDCLYTWSPEGYVSDVVFDHERVETRHTHGTGCTLSSAITTFLGQGFELGAAVGKARQFVRAALLAAPGFGSGHGPMGHHAVR